MARTFSAWIATLLILGAGLAGGLWTNRWAVSAELETAVTRLGDLPPTIGDWEGQKVEALDARQLEIGEIAGHAVRQYKHRRNGQVISVLVVCGRPGPIAVHTPEVCFSGGGFQQAAERSR